MSDSVRIINLWGYEVSGRKVALATLRGEQSECIASAEKVTGKTALQLASEECVLREFVLIPKEELAAAGIELAPVEKEEVSE